MTDVNSQSLAQLRHNIKKVANPKQAKNLQRFFKTGPGEYGEGDIFLGLTVPQARSIAKQYSNISLTNTLLLLRSKYHEERLIALLLLIRMYQVGNDQQQTIVYQSYLDHTAFINNWDLVDLSAHKIVGRHLNNRSKQPLYLLAKSTSLWERRIAIIATFHFLPENNFEPTLKIALLLLHDSHDLIHKAVGWALREIGNRSLVTEEQFLKQHYQQMPRTMLRYAIEKFPESKRQKYLKGKI